MIVIFLNAVFNFFNSKLRSKKHKRRLHELFNIERTPKIGWCIIAFIGYIFINYLILSFYSCLDMFYAFFLFWPANVIPVWLVITCLQLFIPLNLFLRSLCVGLKHYKVHIYASLLILIGIAVNLGDLSEPHYTHDGVTSY
jgi:hypothetical protein